MRRALLATSTALLALWACGGPTIQERSPVADLSKNLPATLEVDRPREGEPRTVKVRVYVDNAIRARMRWRDEVSDQLDYVNQVLTPLAGARLAFDTFADWNRTGEPHQALAQLAELDKATEVTWVIGVIAPLDTPSKAMTDLAYAEPLGRYVVIRGWAEQPESDALAATLPDLKDTERTEVIGAHRRHKQAVVLLRGLATTLGAIAETEASSIMHPLYSPKQTSFGTRNRELITLALDARLAEDTDQVIAKRLADAIDKSPWGGWIAADQEQVLSRLRNVLEAAKAGKTAVDVPAAAYDQFNRIELLAKRGQLADALAELDNLTAAYPGNAAMYLLRCKIMLGAAAKGAPEAPAAGPPITAQAARAACARVSEVAPGDPSPHLAVGEALVKTGDMKAVRVELERAEAKIGNLPDGRDEAWRKLIALYQQIGALTWTEQAIAKAKLEQDPVAVQIKQTRARYGVPRGAKFVVPEQEALLVAAVRAALDQIYAQKYGEAEKTIAAAERKWRGAPGLAAARCDLAMRVGQVDAARAACNRALAGDPDASWALYLAGVIALRDASGTKAGIAKLARAIAVDPELGQAWRALGKAYQRTKDTAALEQLAKDYQARFGQALPR